jgi:NTP pyrophosphatase (non-canonical NTP hydrolase)
MQIAKYNDFVKQTNPYADQTRADRLATALYGLVGEIGSVTSAIKKKLLGEDGFTDWNQPNDEIAEELGDAIWYCFFLAQIENEPNDVDVMAGDIAKLETERDNSNDQRTTHVGWDPLKKESFLTAAAQFSSNTDVDFDQYQQTALLGACANGQQLLRVSVALLWQLAGELLRTNYLVDASVGFSKKAVDRPINVVLGEVCWHLSALATLHQLSMNSVVAQNIEKVNFRRNRDRATPWHDLERDPLEQLPRKFEVVFISLGPRRSRMYLNNRPLGNDLVDNNPFADDGYRFHDAFHLANIAHLGWSPIFRKFMGRVRRRTDEDKYEDSARAAIVEEVVIDAIHSEGRRLSDECAGTGPRRMFPDRRVITLKFLKYVREFVAKLEVGRNQYWEWQDAIVDGAEIYLLLRLEQQGTVTVDMERRTVSYSKDVCVDLKGAVVGLGTGSAALPSSETQAGILLSPRELSRVGGNEEMLARTAAAKRAILGALRLSEDCGSDAEVYLLDGVRVSVNAKGEVRRRMWQQSAIGFQLAFSVSETSIQCTALAIADMKENIANNA